MGTKQPPATIWLPRAIACQGTDKDKRVAYLAGGYSLYADWKKI